MTRRPMSKEELRAHISAFEDAIGKALERSRPRGTCRFCGAAPRVRHEESCAMWPLILARAEYWRQVRGEEEAAGDR